MRAMTDRRRAKIEKVLSQRQNDLTIVMDNIHDPHNVSAIYRSCDAFGVDTVHLYYTVQEFPRLNEKSSASARKWIETKRYSEAKNLVESLHSEKMQILATNCTPTAKTMYEYDLTKPTAIIMGTEHSGVSEELFPLVDGEIYIPMYGMIQSFNVSVAAALLLGEASRQRFLAKKYDQASYTESLYQERLASWLER